MVSRDATGADATGAENGSALEAGGVAVRVDPGAKTASLRYFDADGGFTSRMAEVLGGPIPSPLEAVLHRFADEPDVLMAWRSPTETLVIGGGDARRATIERHASGSTEGCFVDQTGGIVMLTVSGERTGDLLSRLGSNSVIPRPGQAHTARFAELAVTAVCVRPGEVHLLVERVYVRHLVAWIRETLADFRGAG